MANIIKPKRSNTAAKVPTTTELISGELGVNMADRKVYINNGTAVVQVGAGNLSGLGDVAVTSPTNGQSLAYNSTTSKWENSLAGSGDVVGPASATNNALVRFDGTSGKLIQNSLGILDDSGNLDVTSAKADYFDFDTAAAAPSDAVGRASWDDGSGGSILGLKGGNVTYYTGQQEFARVYNGSGAAMTKGQVVYIVGAQGNRIDVRLAQANAESTSANTIGLVAEPIAAGAEGWVQTTGPLIKMVTTGLTAGAAIYLSPTTAGAYTTTKPSAPNHLVILGFVERVSATVGSIYLKIDNGYELDELHNVNISSPTGGQLLAYDQTAGFWKNITLTDGTGVSIAETTAGAVTIGLATAYGDTLNPYASKTANNFLAAPNGAAGVPTFRAIVAADIPTLNQNTTGSAATLTTGRTIAITGDLTYTSGSFNGSGNVTGTGTLANSGVTAGTYTKVTVDAKGRVTVGASLAAGDVPTLNQNTTGTAANVTGTVAVANGGTGQTTYTNGQLLIGNTTGNTLAKATLTAGTGVSITNGAGAITVTNSAPDQTVALTGAGATTISGTYPNFTISSVNTTYGAATSTVPGLIELGSDTAQTVAANAVSATASRSYALQVNANGQGVVNVPWTDTNSGGTVTSVGGTGTVVGLTLTGTVTSSGNLTLGGTFALPNGQVTGKMIYNSFTATAAQTTFTTTNTYTSGKIEVFVNGVKLVNGSDVTVTSGTTVVMASGLPINTQVDLVYPI